MIEYKKICDSIIYVIALNLLYNNFEMIIAHFFYLSNKNLKEI